MSFSFLKINYYKFSEFAKCIYRLFTTNYKLFVIFATVVLLCYYVKSLQFSLQMDQSWLSSTNNFDDNLDRIRNDLQYAIIIDAGSSGSRVYLYVWPPHSGDTRQLLNIRMLHDDLGKDVYHSIKPGLSSCANNPSNASEYISPLLDFAAEHIPKSKHKETPLYILATAGMRLLEKSVQDLILDDLRKDIPKNYSFLFTPNNVEVISGKMEGIYSWISINFLNGKFDHTLEKDPLVIVEHDKKRFKRMNTISMIEMGGASVQIAFEITSNEQYNMLKSKYPGDSFKNMMSEFNLGCSEHDENHQYRLFVATYLTLGANSARNHYVKYLIDSNKKSQFINTSLSTKETILFDPCLPIDSSETINITTRNNLNVSLSTQFLYHLKGSGDFNLCRQNLQQLFMSKGAYWCTNQTCPFDDINRVIVPFQQMEFYGLSEFWYSMNDIFKLGGKYEHSQFVEASGKYCSTSWLVTQDRFKRNLYPNADFKRLLYQCFKSAWMSSVLHDGFRMPTNYSKFKSVSKLNDEPVQWTLGALIFRTRFFPLRTMDNQHGVLIEHVVSTSNANQYLHYSLFAVCMSAVIFCICVYLRRLHTMLNPTNNNKPYYKYNLDGYSLLPSESPQLEHKVFIGYN